MTTAPEAGKFVLDPGASRVEIQQKTMWGLVTVRGAFADLAGEGEVHEDGSAGGVVTFAAASIDTKHPKRDTHLRSADFFDVDQHPTIRFDVQNISLTAGRDASVEGSLTIRGISKPLSLTATVLAAEPDEVTLTTEFVADRGDFGMTWNQMGMMRGLTTVTSTLRFTRRAA